MPESHCEFLSGYMDAVGRAFTTGNTLVVLTVRWLDAHNTPEEILGSRIDGLHRVENWSREFHVTCSGFLGTDGRDRLTFYLIEYITWFKEFSPNVEAFRLACSGWTSTQVEGHVYLLKLDSKPSVLLILSKAEVDSG